MDIEFGILERVHLDEVFDLATRVFSENSTLHQALGITLEAYRDYLHRSFIAMVEEKLSVVARDKQQDRIIGCLIVSDFYHQLEPCHDALGVFSPLAALTQSLCKQYIQHRAIGSGEAVLVDMGAVSSAFIGKGVYQQMRKTAQEHAKLMGFRFVIGELSSVSTQHVVLNKLGHEKVAEVFFKDFAFEDSFPFASIEEPQSIILAEGVL